MLDPITPRFMQCIQFEEINQPALTVGKKSFPSESEDNMHVFQSHASLMQYKHHHAIWHRVNTIWRNKSQISNNILNKSPRGNWGTSVRLAWSRTRSNRGQCCRLRSCSRRAEPPHCWCRQCPYASPLPLPYPCNPPPQRHPDTTWARWLDVPSSSPGASAPWAEQPSPCWPLPQQPPPTPPVPLIPPQWEPQQHPPGPPCLGEAHKPVRQQLTLVRYSSGVC